MELEKKGVPVVVLLSREFTQLGRADAENLGMPSLRIVAVPHPYGSLRKEEALAKADEVSQGIIALLTQASPQPVLRGKVQPY